MSTTDRIDKLRFINKGIISSYFIAEQYWQMLAPLLQNKDVYSKWNYTDGVGGVKVIRMALYTSIIVDLHACLFDNDKRSGSLNNIISGIKDSRVNKELRKEFCIPSSPITVGEHSSEEIKDISEQLQSKEISQQEELFDRVYTEVISVYEEFESSDLALRIKKARSKIFAHKEIRTIEGERSFYGAEGIGIKFNDAKELLDLSKKVIFDTNLLLTNSSYSMDSFLRHHEVVANEFWRNIKA